MKECNEKSMTRAEREKKLNIYLSGYSKAGPFTIDEWFEARQTVKQDKVCQTILSRGKDAPMVRR